MMQINPTNNSAVFTGEYDPIHFGHIETIKQVKNTAM
jgi:cytidyltransferase-like protein